MTLKNANKMNIDSDEHLTSILSSIIENESIDQQHSLGTTNTGLNLASLSSGKANDENARLKDIEIITKSLQRAEDQLKQSQLQTETNNGCEELIPSLSPEMLLDDTDTIVQLIQNDSPIKESSLAVLEISIGITDNVNCEEFIECSIDPCAINNPVNVAANENGLMPGCKKYDQYDSRNRGSERNCKSIDYISKEASCLEKYSEPGWHTGPEEHGKPTGHAEERSLRRRNEHEGQGKFRGDMEQEEQGTNKGHETQKQFQSNDQNELNEPNEPPKITDQNTKVEHHEECKTQEKFDSAAPQVECCDWSPESDEKMRNGAADTFKERLKRTVQRRRRRYFVYSSESDSDCAHLIDIYRNRRILHETSSIDTDIEQGAHPDEPIYQNLLPSDNETEYASLIEPNAGEQEPTALPVVDAICINERPGPKSKKPSTLLAAAMRAKKLLKSAIIIPARSSCCKKPISESDEDFLANTTISLDDIGMVGDDNNLSLPADMRFEREDFYPWASPVLSLTSSPPLPPPPPPTTPENIRKFTRRKKRIIGSGDPFVMQMVKTEPGVECLRRRPTNRVNTRNKIPHSNHSDPNHAFKKEKSAEDYFDMSLNAPYVDSSSDDDYFLPNNTHARGNSTIPNDGRPYFTVTQPNIQKEKKSRIPNDVYFNSTVPLNVLLSYDESSSEDEDDTPPETVGQILAQMPPVHKIQSRNRRPPKKPRQGKIEANGAIPTTKQHILSQLEDLKHFLKVSGITINITDLLKGSKSFQERCDRIRTILSENGIDGEPTLAKCRKLRVQLNLQREVDDLDPSSIIETDENDGQPVRMTRRATKRKYAPAGQSAICSTADDDKSQQLNNLKRASDSDLYVDKAEPNIAKHAAAMEESSLEHQIVEELQTENRDLSLQSTIPTEKHTDESSQSGDRPN